MTSLYLVDYVLLINIDREGDLSTFFSHENQNFPPAFSEYENMKAPDNKSNLLKRVITTADVCDDGEICNCTIYDGGALIHTLHPKTVRTFQEYSDKLFFPYIKMKCVIVLTSYGTLT